MGYGEQKSRSPFIYTKLKEASDNLFDVINAGNHK